MLVNFGQNIGQRKHLIAIDKRTNMTKVFVYGTLLSGFGNNRLLEGQPFLGPAKTKPEFTLVNVGSFPGLVEGGKTAILGEVYEVDNKCLAQLDRLEGCCLEDPSRGLYGRLQIVLENGQEVTAYRYNIGRPLWSNREVIRDYEKIESGDWREFDCSHLKSYCG